MVATARRRAARALARWAVRVDPDPPLEITTSLQRRITVDIAGDTPAMAKALASIISGHVVGRDARY